MNRNIYVDLSYNLNAIEEVYKSANYGAAHKKVRTLEILKKLGSKSAHKQLSKENIADILEEVKAIDSIKDSKKITLNVTLKELQLMRMVVQKSLININRIPSLAREQAIISFTSNFEAYTSDLLREIFDKNMDILKSNKFTLKDEDLIESLKTGNTLETLKEAKIRDLMYGSVKDWINYYQNKLGFKVALTNDLVELYLVRNCLIHNGGLVSKQLESEIKKRRYKLGIKINVTEKDYSRYKNAISQISEELWTEYTRKFN